MQNIESTIGKPKSLQTTKDIVGHFVNMCTPDISRVHTAGCKSTYHRWQVPPGGAPVVSGGENAASCNLPPTKLYLPPTIYL